MRERVAELREALGAVVTVVTLELVPLAHDSLSAEVRAAAALMHLCVKIVPWIVHPRPLNRFTHTVSVALTL